VTTHEIKSCAGSQFDPDIANEFVEAIETVRKERAERREPIPE
jgi:HD-GYP domain-containing protein (c-di-GMP phosphodiesterase class II)